MPLRRKRQKMLIAIENRTMKRPKGRAPMPTGKSSRLESRQTIASQRLADQSLLTGVLPKRLIFKALFHPAMEVGQRSDSGQNERVM